MAEKKSKLALNKTQPTATNVEEYLNLIPEEQKRKDSFILLEMMRKATGYLPILWGASIIGFGNLRYESPNSGREVEWFKIGFAPRKTNISIYLIDLKKQEMHLKELGKHKTGAGCLYINKLADIDITVLEEMILLAIPV